MGILVKKKNYLAAVTAAFIACLLMIIYSDMAVLSAKKGISLWLSSVLPAMLPFFICVNFLSGVGVIKLLPINIFPFAMSVLSGYPMGAKVVGDMCRNGIIDLKEAQRLMSFCSTSGPVFIIGAVGVGILGSQTAGYVAAVSHYIGAITNGIVYSVVLGIRDQKKNRDFRIISCDLLEELTRAIFAGFRSMALILAYIIFFMFIMDMINMTGLFEIIDSDAARSIMQGFMEMTVGCSSLTAADMTLQQQTICASVIISWGGLSILGQSASMLAGTGVQFKYLILTKATHSAFAGIISLFLGALVL